MSLVRDAMMTDPASLDARTSAQEAAQLLVRPDVHTVFVCDGGRLLGVVTRSALVEKVVAAGRDPRTTPLAEVTSSGVFAVGPDVPLEEAFRVMEERDVERLAVTEEGRLVGVLSRSVVGRRLAEDAPEPESSAE